MVARALQLWQELRGATQRRPNEVVKTGQLYILLRCIIVAKQLGHPSKWFKGSPEHVSLEPFS
jgi:hypothetical protein